MGGALNSVVDAVVDTWHFIGGLVNAIFPPKKRIYQDVKVEKVYPSNPNAFRQRLVIYKYQTQSNYLTVRKLILDKATKTNINTLSKFGFLKPYAGRVSNISIPLLQLYIADTLHDTDVNIKYQTKRQYYIYLYRSEYKREFDRIVTYKDKYILVDDYRDKSLYPSPLKWEEPSCNFGICPSIHYEWKYSGHWKDPTDADATILTIDNLDFKIQQYLNKTYSVSYDKQVSTIYTYFIDKQVKIIFNTYTIDDKKYIPVIENNKVKCIYDQDNNVNIVTLENIDDSSDTIDIDMPLDHSNLIVVYYTSHNHPNGNTIILYQEDVFNEYKYLHFFIVTLKKDGKKINYNDEYTKKWLKDNGLIIPKALDNDAVLDQALVYASSYTPPRYKTLQTWNKFIYGDNQHRYDVTIEKDGMTFHYYWTVDYTEKNTLINRNLDINNYPYATAIDKVDEPDLSYVYAEDNSNINLFHTRTIGSKSINFNVKDITSETDPNSSVYLIPIEALQKMPISEFYDAYLDLLYNFIYTYQEQELKWYQTDFFQFLVKITLTAIACYYGGPVGCTLAITSNILYHTLIHFGIDPTVATILILVTTYTVNSYAVGINVLTSQSAANTTVVSISGSGLQSAAATTMGNTTALTTSTTQNLTYATSHYSTIDIIETGIKTNLQTELNMSDYLNYINKGINFYIKYKLDKDKKNLNTKQSEYNQVLNDVTILQKRLQEHYKNTITLGPRQQFDELYDTLYANPMVLQEGLDRSIFYVQFNPIDIIYQ